MVGRNGKKRAAPAEFDGQTLDASGSGTSKQVPKKAKLEYSSPLVPAVKRSPTKPRRGRPRSCANAPRPTITLKPSLPLVVSPEEPHYKLGSFDFYALDHAPLKDAFNVETGHYDYNMIFDIIYHWQQSGVPATVSCFLPDLPLAEEDEKGRMLCRALTEEDDARMHEIVVSSLQITEPFECADVPVFL
ncbi:hypothetical protein BDZ89DRAFT_138854 [Hymenopellis radicata]|nr:hypothetical protein BDZ89DRAFT_138854 [Hymenopellis radicata]